MRMKVVSFNDYKQLKKMSYNDFCRWVEGLYRTAFEEGLHEGESELDNVDVDQWKLFIEKTPGAENIFAISLFVEDFCSELLSIRGIGPKLLDRICTKFDLYEEEEEENGGSLHEETTD